MANLLNRPKCHQFIGVKIGYICKIDGNWPEFDIGLGNWNYSWRCLNQLIIISVTGNWYLVWKSRLSCKELLSSSYQLFIPDTLVMELSWYSESLVKLLQLDFWQTDTRYPIPYYILQLCEERRSSYKERSLNSSIRFRV